MESALLTTFTSPGAPTAIFGAVKSWEDDDPYYSIFTVDLLTYSCAIFI